MEDPHGPPLEAAFTEEVAEEMASENWFFQRGADCVHLWEICSQAGLCIPRCRSRSFRNREEDKGVGIHRIAATGKRLCTSCMNKLSPEAIACLIKARDDPVSYTHLTLPTNREV